MNPTTYQSWVKAASQQLAATSDSAKLDARLLLCHGLSISQSKYLSWPETEIASEDVNNLDLLLEQRLSGRPMAYILGKAEFWGLELTVSEAVLVPRPETETLVEASLDILNRDSTGLAIADLGTGSGAIALALASELPRAQVTALDASVDALTIARQNAADLELGNIHFVQSNWYQSLSPDNQFDLIVSNPPYVAEDDPHLERLTYEPDMALTAKNNGMADIEHIIQCASDYLKPAGYLLIEHGFEQAQLVQDVFHQHGYNSIETIQDLAGNDRVTLGRHHDG